MAAQLPRGCLCWPGLHACLLLRLPAAEDRNVGLHQRQGRLRACSCCTQQACAIIQNPPPPTPPPAHPTNRRRVQGLDATAARSFVTLHNKLTRMGIQVGRQLAAQGSPAGAAAAPSRAAPGKPCQQMADGMLAIRLSLGVVHGPVFPASPPCSWLSPTSLLAMPTHGNCWQRKA